MMNPTHPFNSIKMANRTKHIQSLEALDKEIYRQRLKARGLEKKLDDNLDYLQDNYGSMIRNSVFKSGLKETIVGTVLGAVLGNNRLQDGLAKMASPLAEKAAEWIEKLVNKVKPAKEEDFTDEK